MIKYWWISGKQKQTCLPIFMRFVVKREIVLDLVITGVMLKVYDIRETAVALKVYNRGVFGGSWMAHSLSVQVIISGW